VEFVDEAYRSGQVAELMDERTNPESLWGLVEATELVAVLGRLRLLDPAGLTEVVRTGFIGENPDQHIPPTPDGEGESAVTRARNAVFELVVGAHLSQLDSKVAFDEPDVVAHLGVVPVVAACKRPFGPKGVHERAQDAARQIRRWRERNDGVGIIAIAADRVVSPHPGKYRFEAHTVAEAKSKLEHEIMKGPLREAEASLDAIGDTDVNVIVVQASVPAVIGDRGLDRLSQTTLLFRTAPRGVDPEILCSRLEACFRSM